MKLPEQKGLYWARVGKLWYIVHWTGNRSLYAGLHDIPTVLLSRDGTKFFSDLVNPEDVDEWGDRILEPDPSPA